MTTSNLMNKAIGLVHQGKSYFEIEKEIRKWSNNEEDVKEVLIEIDTYIANYEMARLEKGKVLNLFIIGGLFFFLGIGTTLYTYIYFENQYIFAYGAILFGGWLLLKAYHSYRQPIEAFMPNHSRFHRKRLRR